VSGRDLFVAAVLIFAFASFVTVHVWLCVRIGQSSKPRVRGLVALFLPPFAPIWGYKLGFRRGAKFWVVMVLLYLVARLGAEL